MRASIASLPGNAFIGRELTDVFLEQYYKENRDHFDKVTVRASHIALRLLIERACGAQMRRQPFVIAPGGRPELESAPVSFSLSHTGDVALIAIGSAAFGPIGIDVESARKLRMSAERRARIEADFVGFQAGDEFLVGYGLDWAHRFRGLPYIGVVEKST